MLDETFTNGYSYWFAVILSERFMSGHILYDPKSEHFVTEIDDRLYDIRGDVTEQYQDVKEWYSEEYCMEVPSVVDGHILKMEDFK